MQTTRHASSSPPGNSPFPILPLIAIVVIYACRMLGLFMIFPVFALYAQGMGETHRAWTGVALGIYGFTQVLCQLPFGWASDRWGRRPVLYAGLCLFAAGSALAAMSTHIAGIILGRALQGAGAISGVLLATVADTTTPAQRSLAMGIVGATIGSSFLLALLLGPLLAPFVGGVPGLFAVTALLAVVALFLVNWATPPTAAHHQETPAAPPAESFYGSVQNLWRFTKHHPLLGALYASVFSLHALLTMLFTVLPVALPALLEPTNGSITAFYVSALLSGALPAIACMSRSRDSLGILYAALLALLLGIFGLFSSFFWQLGSWWHAMVALAVYFFGFCYLEARLPALVSHALPRTLHGIGLSVFSMSQFLGPFCGGVIASFCLYYHSSNAIWYALLVWASLWTTGFWWLRPASRVPSPPV